MIPWQTPEVMRLAHEAHVAMDNAHRAHPSERDHLDTLRREAYRRLDRAIRDRCVDRFGPQLGRKDVDQAD